MKLIYLKFVFMKNYYFLDGMVES